MEEKIMSYENFKKSLELVKSLEGYTILGGVDKDLILKAEKFLNIKFSKQHYEYLLNIGCLHFFNHIIYGLDKTEDFSSSNLGGSILQTLKFRGEDMGMPEEWVIILDGQYFQTPVFLDYSQINEDGEPPAILVSYNDDDEPFVLQKIAEDLGDFIFLLIEEKRLGKNLV
jgi:hypothetical protein